MGDPTCEKIKTLVSYLLVGMHMHTFCGFVDDRNAQGPGKAPAAPVR
jgi:hypothetical protein